jgi:hypothetical protein
MKPYLLDQNQDTKIQKIFDSCSLETKKIVIHFDEPRHLY